MSDVSALPDKFRSKQLLSEELAMSINKSKCTNLPADEASYEMAASEEEIYLEETEEELRAILTSCDPFQRKTTMEYWEKQREELEFGWRKRDS